jgi:hypothetical protein
MKTLVCDVCKKLIQNPVHERNYFHIKAWDVCEPCKDQLEINIKSTMRNKRPFNYEWYERLMSESIEKAIGKGRF